MMGQAISPSISVPDTIAELLTMGASVPIGSKGRVYVVGRNDMISSQKLGISLTIRDPQGIVPEEGQYTDWEWGSTGPNATHEFIHPSFPDTFNLDKPGEWRIGIGLYMNPDDPVQVDSYDGVLCVVEAYAGKIISGLLKYDGELDIPIPV